MRTTGKNENEKKERKKESEREKEMVASMEEKSRRLTFGDLSRTSFPSRRQTEAGRDKNLVKTRGRRIDSLRRDSTIY